MVAKMAAAEASSAPGSSGAEAKAEIDAPTAIDIVDFFWDEMGSDEEEWSNTLDPAVVS